MSPPHSWCRHNPASDRGFGDAGDLSAMVVLDIPRKQANDGYAPDLVRSVSSHDLSHGFSGFLELAGFRSPSGDRDYRGYFDTGVTMALGPSGQIDTGLRVGLTRTADDLALFFGVAWRI
ncbi:MAG: hypothetical protein ABI609_06055 [Acidobacteriota bacterium]